MGFSLKLFDIYGTTSQFTFLRKDLHKTNIGGLLSILTIISIIDSAIYFGYNFYQRTSPYFTYERGFEENQTNYIINNSNLYVAIQIMDLSGKKLNFTEYFDLKVRYENWFRLNLGDKLNLDYKTLNIQNCLDFQEYKEFNLNESLCVNISNLSFGGYWEHNNINTIRFELNYCLNKSYCKNITEIKNFLNKNPLNFNFYTRNHKYICY